MAIDYTRATVKEEIERQEWLKEIDSQEWLRLHDPQRWAEEQRQMCTPEYYQQWLEEQRQQGLDEYGRPIPPPWRQRLSLWLYQLELKWNFEGWGLTVMLWLIFGAAMFYLHKIGWLAPIAKAIDAFFYGLGWPH